jgi:hypothetical protein
MIYFQFVISATIFYARALKWNDSNAVLSEFFKNGKKIMGNNAFSCPNFNI